MTLGEYRVGMTFNPGGSPKVYDIKLAAAALIDYLEACKANAFSEQIRLLCLAQTHVEDAAMWGVKAITKEPQNG